MTDRNGVTAGPGVRPRTVELGLELTQEALIAHLHALINHEQIQRRDAERKVAESRERERRYQRALTTIQAPSNKAQTKRNDVNEWSVSDRKVDEVYARVLELRREDPETPMSASWVADQTPGLSQETTRKCFERLRSQERLRIVGKVRGGGVRWDLMPEVAVDA